MFTPTTKTANYGDVHFMKELDNLECMLINGGSYGGERLESGNQGEPRRGVPVVVLKEGINGLGKVLANVDWAKVKDAFTPKPHYNHTIGYWKGGF